MARHRPFDFGAQEDIERFGRSLGMSFSLQEDLAPLFKPQKIGHVSIPNRLAVLPMEGADALPDGAPSELTLRRYRRYAEGGSGLIWFEATAVVREGRAHPRQLMLTGKSRDAYARLLERIRAAARTRFGEKHEILCVLQLTHSGRFSKPQGRSRPLVAAYNPFLDRPQAPLRVISDEELDRLQEDYLEAARHAALAGFDAVDIKSCHGYLINELLSAFTREHSRYGKTFENRTRFLTEVMHRIHSELPRLLLTSRISAYDGIPFPFGFGFIKGPPFEVEMTEIRTLMRRLLLLGGSFFSFSAGNPHLKPHLGRPFDRPSAGADLPEEHPLEGVGRLLSIAASVQSSFPNVPVVGTGYSWLRQFFPYAAAAALARKEATLIGLGRSSFAYPDAPLDLMQTGRLDPQKVCITCSKCSELLRGGLHVGCVVRDAEVYAPEYGKLKPSASQREA